MLKYLLFFTFGFLLAVAVHFILNLPYFMRRRRKRKQELEEHPERKGGTTKVLLFSILITYHIAFIVGIWVVLQDMAQLGTLLTFVGGVTAAAVAFYCWKAKAENLLKIKAGNPDLCGSLSDFSNLQ